METMRPLAYLVWNNDDLKRRFLASSFSAGLTDSPPSDLVLSYKEWLAYPEKDVTHGVFNILRVVEFVISLRGLPHIHTGSVQY
jgi:hypothetical protein